MARCALHMWGRSWGWSKIMGLSDIDEVAISIDSQHGAEAVDGFKEKGECQHV